MLSTFCFVASSNDAFVLTACSAVDVELAVVFVAAKAETPAPPITPTDKAPAII